MKELIRFLKWLIMMAIAIFWILDVCNMPFMEIFDTIYPLNGLFWFLMVLLCSAGTSTDDNEQKKVTSSSDIENIPSTQTTNKGCRLIESWVTDDMSLDDVYEEQERLNQQGFFTVIQDSETITELYRIQVYQKSI